MSKNPEKSSVFNGWSFNPILLMEGLVMPLEVCLSPFDLKIFRRACFLCCGSPSKNSTLFSHNQLRTIAQRRKPRKKNFSNSAFSQNLILTFGLLSQFGHWRPPYDAEKSFMKSNLNYQTYTKSLQCWAIADEQALLLDGYLMTA